MTTAFEKALKRMEQHQQSGGSKTDYVKLGDGEYSVLRILPETGGMELPWQIVGRHYFSGKDSILCPAFTTEDEEECILCEMRIAAYKANEKDIPPYLSVRKSFHMSVIERKMLYGEADDKGRQPVTLRWYEGPKVWTPGILAFKALGRIVGDPEYGEVWNLEEGIDIKLSRTGEGKATEWGVMPAKDVTPVFTPEFDFEFDDSDDPQWNTPADLEKVLEGRPDLSRILQRLPSEDELKEAAGLQESSQADDDWAS